MGPGAGSRERRRESPRGSGRRSSYRLVRAAPCDTTLHRVVAGRRLRHCLISARISSTLRSSSQAPPARSSAARRSPSESCAGPVASRSRTASATQSASLARAAAAAAFRRRAVSSSAPTRSASQANLSIARLAPRARPPLCCRPIFATVLIANRGEIALRIVRALRDLDIMSSRRLLRRRTGLSQHVRYADEAHHIGPADARQSYLDGDRIIRHRVGGGRGRDPSRLRLPRGERGLRRGLRQRRAHLHRAVAGLDAQARRQDCGARDGGRRGGSRWCRAASDRVLMEDAIAFATGLGSR